ncbi:GTPase HflX [Brachyspira hyodysenteriae]|uniref:GTPase HflX n=1 Tax=Brachyspira hyodysenteriae TaxID=159 RepID=UPI002B256BCF|nr:GTPase HflX [Brachyspira hyodysenteriae]WPC37974.1 GTPase HflX [Brachyspira hyodysenteriae]
MNNDNLKKAYIIFVTDSRQYRNSKINIDNILNELAMLCDTAGYEVVNKYSFIQPKITAGTYIGTGKLESLKESATIDNVEYFIFDNELSGSQVNAIEEGSNITALTRTEIILEIFALRAKTMTAKMQVELAFLEFEYPRLKGKRTNLSQIKGGIGLRGGAGEKQLEYDRRRARERIHKLKSQLSKVEKSASTGRKGRENTFRIAIVGYTNAGKSTLFNLLCKESVYVEDKLFATLDTHTRKLYLSDDTPVEVIISDTVGFIDRLPHTLVASFKSTLSEVVEADLLLHLSDASDENIEEKLLHVESIIKEIDASHIKRMVIFNKSDAIDEVQKNKILTSYDDAIFISAKNNTNIELLRKKILDTILELNNN